MIYIEQIRSALSELKPELRKPWVILDRLPYIHATDDQNAKPYSTPVVGRFDYMESADYIMACNPDAMSNVLSYVDTLKAERDAAMKDAERYRWCVANNMVLSGGSSAFGWPIAPVGRTEWDRYIDAAITKKEGRTE